MTISRTDYGPVKVVHAQGYLSGLAAAELDRYLGELLAGRGPHKLVLDLSAVTEMSSAGLRAVISAAKRARSQKGGDLRLVAPNRRVTEVLELAGLVAVIPIYPTVEDAVASYAPSSTAQP